MINMFKKMTPEEAVAFRKTGLKFMIAPFAIIVIIAVAIVFSTIQKSSLSFQNNDVSQITCHKDLKQCGSGCIPQNAVCCDETNGNSYCLWPDTLCKANPVTNGEKERFVCSEDEKVKSYDCETGQIFCGMFCIDAGERCCLGGVCDEEKTSVTKTSQVSNSKKDLNEQFKYGGEITINANFEKDNNVGQRNFWHSSAQFSTVIHFSNLVMSSGMAHADGTPISEGGAKLTGTYTASCSDSGSFEGRKDAQDSVSGEIVDPYASAYGGSLGFQEIFDTTVTPSRRLGFKLSFSSPKLIPSTYRETWCSSAQVDDYISTIIEDIWRGTYGNNQRIANIWLQKTGYISDEGETIQFSGTIEDSSQNKTSNGTTYTGTFKIYREQ